LEILLNLLQGGFDALFEYLSLHVLACLIPAFFIAGAISVFASQAAILKYFGPQAKKILSYTIASVSGMILAVCSCTVLPLFGSIYKRGSGIGPAITFLYSGPAINILAIVYSARLLGYDIGAGRAIGAILFSVVIGLIMAAIYKPEEPKDNAAPLDMLAENPDGRPLWQHLVFFGSLVGILISAASGQWIITGVLLIILITVVWRFYSVSQFKEWMKETGRFIRLITPWLLVGIFIAGILKIAIPAPVVANIVGGNGLLANFVASFVGSVLYFATLTEVPIVRTFLDLGMGEGPALALLLAGPALSLPNMLVIRSIMGTRKTLTYIGLVIVMATITGYIFGFIM
jgi:uncharacterized membrane protein YraQ (UPF0718 family)